MSTFQQIHESENAVIGFIKDNTNATDVTLQTHFKTKGIDRDSLYETIDNLILEEKIKRTYPEESQVPLYVLV